MATTSALSFSCPAGQYLLTQGTDSCTTCPAGSFCSGGVGAVATQCTPNNYCTAGVSSPTPCPINNTSPAGSDALSDCIPNNTTLSLKAFLSGGFKADTDSLGCGLRARGLLPAAQPYNTAPFNYTGSENLSNNNYQEICDWVLLQIRNPTTSAVVFSKAVILKQDGQIAEATNLTQATNTTNLAYK